ncbi:MAG: putative outer membrane protein pmp20, partial [Phycisphaerales bacterium]|nr:putative outer membrane protein pmp20 [Phycisphaerales bacterium]
PLTPRRSNTTQNDAPVPLPPRKSSGDTAQAQSVAAAPGASRNPLAARPSEGGGSLDGMLSLAHGGAAGASGPMPALAHGSALWKDLDAMSEKVTSEEKLRIVAGTASFASVGISVAYFIWALRAGSVLSSLLSSIPSWKFVDPLPILDQMARKSGAKRAEEDDEGLESMVQGTPEAA